MPDASPAVVQRAAPESSAIDAHSVAVPSLKVTEPVGVPDAPLATTEAVKVTDSPTADGFFDDARETVGVELVAEVTVKVYDAIAPTSGLLCGPVSPDATCPSIANAWIVCEPEARLLNVAVYGPLPVVAVHAPSIASSW